MEVALQGVPKPAEMTAKVVFNQLEMKVALEGSGRRSVTSNQLENAVTILCNIN